MDRIVETLRTTHDDPPLSSEVLIISSDALMSLDIQMFLKSQGFLPQIMTFPTDATMQVTQLSRYSAVILDIERPSDATLSMLDWLTQGLRPIIVVSTFDEGTVEGLPPGTIWHAKPLRVDDLVVRA